MDRILAGDVYKRQVVEGRTTNGTITDVDGNFSLSVPANSTLTISFVGYKTQTVPVNGKNSLKVTLQEDTEVLDEVVVAVSYTHLDVYKRQVQKTFLPTDKLWYQREFTLDPSWKNKSAILHFGAVDRCV